MILQQSIIRTLSLLSPPKCLKYIECVTVFKVCAACQTPCAASQHSTYVVRLYSDFMTLSTDYM